MSEKQGGISASFYMQIGMLVSIVISSIVGFNYLGTLIEDKIDDKVSPLLAKIQELESKNNDNYQLIADNSRSTTNAIISLNRFLEHYNRIHHTEFLRPSDITSESIVTKYKKQK